MVGGTFDYGVMLLVLVRATPKTSKESKSRSERERRSNESEFFVRIIDGVSERQRSWQGEVPGKRRPDALAEVNFWGGTRRWEGLASWSRSSWQL